MIFYSSKNPLRETSQRKMMRSCLIFLELVFLWGGVFSSDLDEDKVTIPAVKYAWMVNVTSVIKRQYSPSIGDSLAQLPDSVSDAYKKILCGGVIVSSKLIYVPGICVKNVRAEDLTVSVQSSGDAYTVKSIKEKKLFNTYPHHALLVLNEKIKDHTAVPVIGPTESAYPRDCLVSELFTHSLDNPKEEVPRKGAFGVLKPMHCFDLDVFSLKNELAGSSSGGRLEFAYSSPLICPSQSNPSHYKLVGFWAWAFLGDPHGELGYKCVSGKTDLRRLINQNL